MAPRPAFARSKFLALFGKTPLHFVANQGQLDEAIIYHAKSESVTIFCTETGLVFGFAEGSISLKFSKGKRVRPEAKGELPGKINYFVGNDPASWQTNIPTFREIVYREVYPGTDLIYSGDQRHLKYTFHLQPGADPDQIEMVYEGVEGVRLDEAAGELVIQTEWGDMRDAAPTAHQDIDGVREAVTVSFHPVSETRVGFSVGDYDPNFPLVIDPGYSTYLDGEDWDAALAQLDKDIQTQHWSTLMKTLLDEPLPWPVLTEVFHVD